MESGVRLPTTANSCWKADFLNLLYRMVYFTADLHFYHDKIIRHTQRPFHNAEEMNKALIKKRNNKISCDDEVYILGDFTMKGGDHTPWAYEAIMQAVLQESLPSCSIYGEKNIPYLPD